MMEIQKVIDPVLLSALAGQGVDKERVELFQDYASRFGKKERSPYSQFYQDMKSGKRFMLVQGLPMVDAYGFGHELAWHDKNGIIENGNNIFHCIVTSSRIQLVALSDQPYGVKNSDNLTYHPQLFIGVSEIKPISDMPKLLETDPLNENYSYNTLEWDYGICKRRVRIIEGRYLGYWIFISNPKADVLIKYNQFGKLRLKLQYAKDEDTEFIPKAYFDAGIYPIIITDSATFYPDAHPETASVDGFALRALDNQTWAGIRDGVGTGADDSATTAWVATVQPGTNNNTWYLISRGIFLFDTSALPDGATITAAVLSLRGSAKYVNAYWTPIVNVYSSNPASNTAVVAADYLATLFGTTAFSIAIAYADWTTANYNSFALNAAGIAAISKTNISKFAVRDAGYDVANSAPTWYATGYYVSSYFSEQGNGYQPKLVVTFTVPPQKVGRVIICSVGPHPRIR